MKALVGAFNQEKALVGAFSVITNLRMEFGWNFLKHYVIYFKFLFSPMSWHLVTVLAPVVVEELEGGGRAGQLRRVGHLAVPHHLPQPIRASVEVT